MTRRAGPYIALAGLITAVFCGVPAVVLVATFGWERNWFFDARDDAFRLAAAGALGLVVLAVGLAVAASGERRAVATACSLACLAAIVPWLLFCLLLAATSTSEYLPGMAGLL